MPLNLITDAWIPVRTVEGGWRVVRPDQIAEAGVARPDWPRADFNLACYELLIGLVFLADPPEDETDWDEGRAPDPERLREALAPLAPAFNLDGPGPRFLQDYEELDAAASPIDMLFIDSSGGNTAKNNADLMVKRGRYAALPAPLAAMALFTLQSQAPSGGAGNRTSMRGGGPLITLVEPSDEAASPLWDMVWTNVPDGEALPSSRLGDALPWMRKTRTSEKGTTPVQPPDEKGLALAEAFFGMPRRLRLDFAEDDAGLVIGVRQRPFGTNYGLWRHPLSPYYQQKAGSELLPVHPKPGIGSYRNWAGIAFQERDGLRHVADVVAVWKRRLSGAKASLHIGGWAMDNMKPRDFLWSRQPLYLLDSEGERAAVALVQAANAFALALLAGAMQTLTGAANMDASTVETAREAFFADTQSDFEAMLSRLSNHEPLATVAPDWVATLRRVALGLYDARAVPGLADRRVKDVQDIIEARGRLLAAFSGWGPKTGQAAYKALGLTLPKKRAKKKEPAA